MKIFVILSRVPYPLEKGDKLRAYNHIRELSKNHEIVLCALNDDSIHKDAVQQLSQFCSTIVIIKLFKLRRLWNLCKAIFTGLPFQVAYFYQCTAKYKVMHLIEQHKPDHIFCQLLRVAEYVKHFDIPKTLDYQDAFSKGIERRIHISPPFIKLLLKAEYKRLLKYENMIFNSFDNKIIISPPDRSHIPHHANKDIVVIPNGVDIDYYQPLEREKKFELLFSGNMQYPPNVNSVKFLVKSVLPLVWKTMPDVHLMIAGTNPTADVISLKSEKVTVTGWVDDMRECYASAKIFIAPMQIGIGMQNKLLEAMSTQLPCITTPLANDALNAENGTQILVGSNVEELTAYILLLLKDNAKAMKIGKNGYDFVMQNYSWASQTQKLIELIESTKKLN